MSEEIYKKALAWLMGDDCGMSSKAILSHMLGVRSRDARTDYPYDPADLGRCLRLLALFPEWKPRIKEMAQYGPGWAGQVKVRDVLKATMEREVGIDWSKGKRAPETYEAMKLAQADGYRSDAINREDA